MVSSKSFLCRCEDITVSDCQEAITDGYACFEDLKRFLGVGTGPCQGKSCVQAAMHLISEARGILPDEVDVMTFRPPVRPIAFETLAASPAEGETEAGGTDAGGTEAGGTEAGRPGASPEAR